MTQAFFVTPEDAEQAFYDALRSGNVDAVMEVWSADDDIVCLHPAGQRLVGPAAIQASWEQILANGGLRVDYSTLHVARNPLCAVHSVLERVDVAGGAHARFAFVAATNVYMKEADGWRMVLHHGSPVVGQDVGTAGGHLPVLH